MTLVADLLQAARGGLVDRACYGISTAAADAVRGARRYALTAEARDFALSVLRKPSQSHLLMETLRTERGESWIEWKKEGGGAIEFDGPKPTCDRIGVLFRPLGNAFLEATAAWSFKNPALPVTVSPIGCVYDCTDVPRFRTEMLAAMLAPGIVDWAIGRGLFDDRAAFSDAVLDAMGEPDPERIRSFAKASKLRAEAADIEAMARDAMRFVAMPTSITLPFCAGVLRDMPERIAGIARDAASDIAGEIGLAMVALALVKTGAVETRPADLDKINRARRKARKPEILAHDVVDLDWSFAKRLAAAGMSRADIRAHLVSGHFKRRATGVFWWRPHVRGMAA